MEHNALIAEKETPTSIDNQVRDFWIYTVTETDEDIKGSGANHQEAAANLLFALNKRFLQKDIPAGKIFSVLNVPPLSKEKMEALRNKYPPNT